MRQSRWKAFCLPFWSLPEICPLWDYSQARTRYRSLPDAEKARLADAIGWELAQAPMEIRKRQLDLFAKVSADLANRVSREIYLFETGKKG